MSATYFGGINGITLKCTRIMLAVLLALLGREEREMFQIYESSEEPYVERQIGKRQCITAL